MLDIFGLEDNLPDELVSSGNNWADQFTSNKPPAQGPGPGNLNGEDPGVSSVVLQRQLQQQQQLQHLMQQVNKLHSEIQFMLSPVRFAEH